jgi:hypothetical protein
MSTHAVAAHTGPPDPIPIFTMPGLSPLDVAALQTAELSEFYELNRADFTKLVTTLYVAFLERTAELRKKKPAPEKLFTLFCADVQMVLTAASPQWESLQIERPEKSNENGLARAFLWNHMRKENVLTWQDFYAEGKREIPKAKQLVSHFVHFVVVRAFEDGAVPCIPDPACVRQARNVVQEINRGKKDLKPV